MGETIIRRAVRGDAKQLSDIGVRTFVETFGHLYASADLQMFLATSHSLSAYERLLGASDSAAWLAEQDGAAIGYAVAGPCTLPVDNMPPRSGELGRLYLDGAAQGRGLGVQLLETAFDWLESHFEHIYISVYSENVGAQRLYARYGFSKIKEYKYMVGNHADHEFLFGRQ